MHIGRVCYLLGMIILVVGGFMFLPLFCALIYGESDAGAFLRSIPIALAIGGGLLGGFRRCRNQQLRLRESFLFVTGSWLLASLVGALPYLFAGSFGDLASAVFETASGFTTTGSTAMPDIEIMPHGILLWRSLTHWLGGAGIVLLFVALLQGKHDQSGGEGVSVFKAEYAGGLLAERVAPRIEDNARAIFAVYLCLTAACILALLLAGMNFFDAVNHAFSTVSTGGFSTKNLSIGAYHNPAIEWVTALFLFLSSINFALFYLFFFRRRRKYALGNPELRCFFWVVAVAVMIITLANWRAYPDAGLMYNLRHAAFQAVAIISTGGFTSANFELWPDLSRFVLFTLLFIGGCSGSTAGSIKINRWYVAAKATRMELFGVFRPSMIRRVYYNRRAVSETLARQMTHYLFLYIICVFIGGFLLTLCGMDWLEAFAGALASIGNVGPAIGSLGPAGTYAAVPAAGKYLLSFMMIIGRLEIYTVLVLFMPEIWRK
ncbi:MAG: TrkH family potassium uptake protein [Clostridia bacterium]|nr:TrkH family potassium uptake protein [Clostridia bacterium]